MKVKLTINVELDDDLIGTIDLEFANTTGDLTRVEVLEQLVAPKLRDIKSMVQAQNVNVRIYGADE